MNAAPIFVPDRLHIRHVILFLFLSNSKITEIEERMVEVYKDNVPQRQTISRWVHRFKNNDISLAEEARSGRPVVFDIDKLREVVESDPFQSIRKLATVMGSTHSAVERGLRALGKLEKMGRWIPHKLSNFDLERRVDMSLQLLTLRPSFNWLDHLVTSDEKWVLYENHHRRSQWVDADKQPEDVVKQELHPKKILLSVWWSVHGVLYWELLSEGKTITADYYSSQLQKMKSKLYKLHQNQSASVHTSPRSPSTMKSSLLISLLLLAPAFICLVNGVSFTRGFCLQLINNLKSGFAEKYHVANMNGLSYDKKLEKKILEQLSFTNECPQPSIISHNGFDIYLNINNEDSFIDLLSGVGKTTMACINTKCEENGEEIISIVTDYSDIPAISGAPGSQCSDSRTVNSDGLCIREKHRNGYERKFLDSIGGILKEAAEKTGKIGIGIGQTIQDGTTALGKELDKTFGDSETKVAHKVVSGGEKSYSVKDALEEMTKGMAEVAEKVVELAEEPGKKYVRKGLWNDLNPFTQPPFDTYVPHRKYQKKEDDEHVPNEEIFWSY